MITIIDYGAGNIKSIQNMLKKLGAASRISSNVGEIEEAEKLILPGVGHFDHGMKNLKSSGLIEVLNSKVVEQKCPILGICLGAQLLGDKSEEGEEPGLGWVPMKVVKFDKTRMDAKLKVPHMGWNLVKLNKKAENNPLMKGLENEARFYFVHAFHMLPNDNNHILTTSTYGYEFASAIWLNNIYGVQFHPEKSHVFGLKLLENFASL